MMKTSSRIYSVWSLALLLAVTVTELTWSQIEYVNFEAELTGLSLN